MRRSISSRRAWCRMMMRSISLSARSQGSSSIVISFHHRALRPLSAGTGIHSSSGQRTGNVLPAPARPAQSSPTSQKGSPGAAPRRAHRLCASRKPRRLSEDLTKIFPRPGRGGFTTSVSREGVPFRAACEAPRLPSPGTSGPSLSAADTAPSSCSPTSTASTRDGSTGSSGRRAIPALRAWSGWRRRWGWI